MGEFDDGHGAAVWLYQSGVLLRGIHQLILTHLHSDPIVCIPDVLFMATVSIIRCTYDNNLIVHAKGADIIIHEVGVVPPDKLESLKELQLIMSKRYFPGRCRKSINLNKAEVGRKHTPCSAWWF